MLNRTLLYLYHANLVVAVEHDARKILTDIVPDCVPARLVLRVAVVRSLGALVDVVALVEASVVLKAVGTSFVARSMR